jgi:uncharacterized membrane protein
VATLVGLLALIGMTALILSPLHLSSPWMGLAFWVVASS